MVVHPTIEEVVAATAERLGKTSMNEQILNHWLRQVPPEIAGTIKAENLRVGMVITVYNMKISYENREEFGHRYLLLSDPYETVNRNGETYTAILVCEIKNCEDPLIEPRSLHGMGLAASLTGEWRWTHYAVCDYMPPAPTTSQVLPETASTDIDIDDDLDDPLGYGRAITPPSTEDDEFALAEPYIP